MVLARLFISYNVMVCSHGDCVQFWDLLSCIHGLFSGIETEDRYEFIQTDLLTQEIMLLPGTSLPLPWVRAGGRGVWGVRFALV